MCAGALLTTFASTPSALASSTTTYTYDALGRLRTVTVAGPQTSVQSYTYDSAGNRTQTTSGIVPSVPPSISMPTSSTSGSYTISWGASTGTVTAYELYQATNSGFSGQTLVYSGAATSAALSGRGNGTYYYRVRACSTSAACSGYRTGANGVTVTLPPSVPSSISVPSGSTTGSYAISWGSSSGNVTAYELYEANNSSFTGAVLAYSGTATSRAISGKGNGTYYYRVRACNTTAACSGYRTGANPINVTPPPGVPGSASVPSYNNTGAYTVSWSASTGTVTAYELLESSTATGLEGLIYSGTATSVSVSGRADSVYSYRLRACNTSVACSAYTATQGNGPVVYVDKIAPTPPASVNMTTTSGYVLYWSGGSTDTAGSGAGSGVGSWRVYRNGSHIGTSLQPQQSFQDPAPPTNVTLAYNVRSVDRAGNESGNSPTHSIYIDTVPPTTPGNFRATSVTTGSVSLAWDASSDAFGIAYYRITRSGSVVGYGDASLAYADNTVSSNTTYTYQIFAVDGHGVESSPASVTVTTPSGAPSVPTMNTPLVVQNSSGNFSIGWAASSGPVAYYLLEEDTGGGGFTTYASYQVNVPSTSKSFSGRSSGEYYFRVKACASGGICSGYSATKFILVCIGGCALRAPEPGERTDD